MTDIISYLQYINILSNNAYYNIKKIIKLLLDYKQSDECIDFITM
jgi:hypothetical protein